MKKIYILLFICSQAFTQTIHLKGRLADSNTKEPVIYANISFLESNVGVSSTEKGTFYLEIDKKLLNKKVHISCLNYKDTIVFASELQDKILFLQSKNVELDEVVISKKVDKEFTIDKYRRKHIKSSFGGRQSYPWIVAKYFNYEEKYQETPYLKEVIVYFGSIMTRKKSKFRIRLFKIDTLTGKPSEDLTEKNIIGFSRKINGKVKVDVSELDIEFPKEGFFVGLERIHIPYNFYEYSYTMKGSKKKHITKAVAPSFGAVYTKDSIFNFSRGKWMKYFSPQKFYNGNNIEPAISLTLSN